MLSTYHLLNRVPGAEDTGMKKMNADPEPQSLHSIK